MFFKGNTVQGQNFESFWQFLSVNPSTNFLSKATRKGKNNIWKSKYFSNFEKWSLAIENKWLHKREIFPMWFVKKMQYFDSMPAIITYMDATQKCILQMLLLETPQVCFHFCHFMNLYVKSNTIFFATMGMGSSYLKEQSRWKGVLLSLQSKSSKHDI